MLYVLRDDEGKINAVSEEQMSQSWEPAVLEDDELRAFLSRNPAIGERVMQASDAEFIRVLEDLIDILIAKQVFHFTDLPIPVQKKLLSRRQLRAEMQKNDDSTALMDNDGTIF